MTKFEVIIVGGSYAGLAAAMGLGRALRSVLVVDSGMAANRFTPRSHNFLTHDGRTPSEIAGIARDQVGQYDTVDRIDAVAVKAEKTSTGFKITLNDGVIVSSSKLVLATGIIDIMPDIPGLAECWGKSVLHCPYCHGYEVRETPTGILGNGDYAFEFASLISNWTRDLTIYTDGPSRLSTGQTKKLASHNIRIVEDRIKLFKNTDGNLEKILFANGMTAEVKAVYTRPAFKQHSDLAVSLGCEMTEEGYIKIDSGMRTTTNGVYACGDNASKMRTVANAVSMGTTAAITLNKDMITESF